MEAFRVLIMDDDNEWTRATSRLLKRDRRDLIEGPDRELVIDIAENQRQADDIIGGTAACAYDLVLLDLVYPLNEDRGTEDYRGPQWLPTLRKAQPSAAIAVATSFAHERGLKTAVDVLLTGDADEFIPKDVRWTEMLARLKAALVHRRMSRQLAATASPVLSNVARTSAQDIHAVLSTARTQLRRLVAEAAKDPRLITSVTKAFDGMQADVAAITERLAGRIDRNARAVACCELLEGLVLRFEPQISRVIPVRCVGDCRVLTYPDDLGIAVVEVLQNAVDAISESGSGRPDPIRVHVVRCEDLNSVRIEVLDHGQGLSSSAVADAFRPGRSYWSRDPHRHKGMGLYVARRMMQSVGGDVAIEPTDDAGTKVTLVVRDWGSK